MSIYSDKLAHVLTAGIEMHQWRCAGLNFRHAILLMTSWAKNRSQQLIYFWLCFQVPTWLDQTAAASRKSKVDQKRTTAAVDSFVPKTPTSVKKQMSIMAFVKKKKDEALATRIMSGLSASPGMLPYVVIVVQMIWPNHDVPSLRSCK